MVATPSPVSLRRLDARFLLPEWPRSAAVLDGLPGWSEAAAASGLLTGAGPVDLVIAPPELAATAAAGGAASVLMPGRRRGHLPEGYLVERLLALPDPVDPRAVVPRRHRLATGYLLTTWLAGRSRRSRLRNGVAGTAARVGLLPPVLPEISLLTRSTSPPAVLTAASQAGLLPELGSAQWFLGAESGAESKRLGLFVFSEGADIPSYVLKLDRRPGLTNDREGAQLELVRRTGGAVARHAPALAGRMDFHGHEVLVQTACPGATLGRVLLGPASVDAKTRILESVVGWLLQVARETAGPPVGVDDATTADPDALSGVPRVFAHGDLAPGNVLVGSGTLGIVDWEHANRHSFPLWDLLYFAAHALPLLDGEGEDPADDYLRRLFRGEAPASVLLFRWVQRLRAELALDEDAVASLALGCWAHYADVVGGLRAGLNDTVGSTLPPLPVERVAALWWEDPGLGPRWRAWRDWLSSRTPAWSG